MFFMDLRTNRDYMTMQYELIGFITDKTFDYCAVRAEY